MIIAALVFVFLLALWWGRVQRRREMGEIRHQLALSEQRDNHRELAKFGVKVDADGYWV